LDKPRRVLLRRRVADPTSMQHGVTAGQ
jgi:hypothetical protein